MGKTKKPRQSDIEDQIVVGGVQPKILRNKDGSPVLCQYLDENGVCSFLDKSVLAFFGPKKQCNLEGYSNSCERLS